MSMPPTACASCGAALRDGADACDLCGTSADAVSAEDGAVCPQCGHAPPPGSRFCNACGERLVAEVPAAPPRRPVAPEVPAADRAPRSSAGARRAFAVTGIGLAAVVALYAATVFSADRQEPEPEDPTGGVADLGPAQDIPDGAPPLPDSLQVAADAFASQGDAAGWYESGRFYLTAAFNVSQTDPTSSVRWARRAIEDFERSLDLNQSADVRVALAEAAAFDPSNPMRPVQELQAALAADPQNTAAHFLMGERRLLIGRLDSARASFERVLEIAPPGDPLRERARSAMLAVQQAGGPAE